MTEQNNSKEENKTNLKEFYKNINNVVTGDILANLAYSSMIMIYFLFFNIQYEVVPELILSNYINISSIGFLIISILLFLRYLNHEESLNFPLIAIE